MQTEKWGTAKFLGSWLNENHLKIQPVGKNLNIGGKAKITILWPDEKTCRDKTLGDNDKSVVTLIEFAGSAQHVFRRKILLCSDIEKFAQRKFLDLFPDLKVDVVATPHHSSVISMEPGFIERLEADISICSCGRTQYERLLKIKRKDHTKTFYTARDGAIKICVKKDGTLTTATCAKQ
jgi:beta-lactamase superfamily II metal-dependent hydrolase